MKKMIIQGGNRLSGEVTIGGAKNSTVALIPAAILADTPVQFDTVPDILDVHNLMIILESMNVKSSFKHGVLNIDPNVCLHCGRCVSRCPFHTVDDGTWEPCLAAFTEQR